MKVFRVLIALGGILLVAGIYLVLPAASVSNSETDAIPAGNYYYAITFSVQKAGLISGSFSETSGKSINLYVFDSGQFASYKAGNLAGDMFAVSGSTGTYSASVFSPGTYYLVLEHTAASANQAESVQLTWNLTGMNPVMLGIGAGVLAVGVVLVAVGYLKRRGALPPPSATDVIMFNQPKPGEAPPATP